MAPPSIPELFQQAMRAYVAGDYPTAERLCAAMLKSAPRSHQVLHLQGLIDNRRGKPQRAAKTIRRAIALAPREAAYHNNLGEVLRSDGDLAGAIAAYRRAIELRPGYPEALSNLGIAMMAQGHPDEAEKALSAAIALQPKLLNARFNLGVLYAARGDRARAEAVYRELLELDPANADAWVNLGHLQEPAGDRDGALLSYQRALHANPDLAQAHMDMARMERAQYRYESALAHLRRAVEIEPKRVEAWVGLGQLYTEVAAPDAVERAHECFRRALELDPGSADGLVGLAGAQLAQGERDQAIRAVRRALQREPGHIGAQAELARARTFDDPGDAELTAMRVRFDGVDVDDESRAALGFALGKAYTDLGDHATAFRYLEIANQAARKGYDYRVQDSRAFMDGLKRIFSEARMAQAPAPLRGELTPVFIVGMPRSGTTLVEQILASHPAVSAGDELNYLNDLVRARCDSRGPGMESLDDLACFERMSDEHFSAVGRGYLERLRTHDKGHGFVTDKLPHNFLYVGLIRLALPQARVIHCRRDPADTCLSLYERSFLGYQPYAYDLRELGEYYRLYHSLMGHWRQCVGDFMLEVRYEDLVHHQEAQTRRILEFCGLPFDPRCLAFERTRRAVQTASMLQVRQPIYASSIDRWRRFAPYLGPLLEALGGDLE